MSMKYCIWRLTYVLEIRDSIDRVWRASFHQKNDAFSKFEQNIYSPVAASQLRRRWTIEAWDGKTDATDALLIGCRADSVMGRLLHSAVLLRLLSYPLRHRATEPFVDRKWNF